MRGPARLAVAATAGLLSCGDANPGRPLSLPASAPSNPRASRVITIVMENKEDGDVIGTRDAPYVNRLARRGGLATRSYGVRHPSLPNYLALTSGSTHGGSSECNACHVRAASIAAQREAAQLGWRAYMEDLPRPCFAGAHAGDYAKKHDPFMYY